MDLTIIYIFFIKSIENFIKTIYIEIKVLIKEGIIDEVILALPATVDGQTTAHYVADRLSATSVKITSLARGVPIGGELDYLDDGTLQMALKSRRGL